MLLFKEPSNKKTIIAVLSEPHQHNFVLLRCLVKVVVSEVVYMLPQSVIGHPGCGWMYVAMNYSWVLKMKYGHSQGHSTPHPTEKVI